MEREVLVFNGGGGDGRCCKDCSSCYDAIVIGSGYGGSVAACRMSMAGIKVCLIERGRRWESQDFRTQPSKFVMSAIRMDMGNLGGLKFGAKDALFQIHEQGDSVAVTACGLGGGSLINAGVLASTPIRARRNPKWPKEWDKDWELCEATASTMLGSQSAPVEFSNDQVMNNIVEEEIEESFRSSINLSINFESSSQGKEGLSSCLACGNCLSGCPYNAKNSTDKNYLASAIKAGCAIKTQCQVQYIVENPGEGCNKEGSNSEKRRKRWRVFLNDIDYISSDFVIISGGVLGTAEILFKSRSRGLNVSESLGHGFSCNGNNVAYVDGSPAPLNAFGLDKTQFSKIPYQARPGPSISSSYTSSLGFSIQTAVVPVSFPKLLFKGIWTYGWPTESWFSHSIIDRLEQVFSHKNSQGMVLNTVGFDENNGRITFDGDTEQISFAPPQDPLLARKIQAFQKVSKRLGGSLFMSKYRSTSVHLLGGCSVAADHTNGVCNHYGQVFDPSLPETVHPGLYICDASLIPCSIGINPCLTIATAAEYVSRHLVQDILTYKNSLQQRHLHNPNLLLNVDKCGKEVEHEIPTGKCLSIDEKLEEKPTGTVVIWETMRGYISGMPCTAYLRMKMNSKHKKGVYEQNQAGGEAEDFLLKGKVGGYVIFEALEKSKLHIIEGEVDMCRVDDRTPYTQYMQYHLILASASGSKYILEGKKIMNPFLLGTYAWRESTTFHVTLRGVHQSSSAENVDLKGELHISFMELLRSIMNLSGNKRRRFAYLLLQSLLRTYVLQVPRGRHWDLSPGNLSEQAYPPCILHEIQTDDGVTISCRQWKCSQSGRSEAERRKNPVLLINGYSIESYCLPTEPKDLVRSLLNEGYETWLLEARLHPRHPSNDFTVEDIGKFDIPAAIKKIQELNKLSVKVHVVAHCVGGLSIHIALMGGHISADNIASLCCSNSSMFFKLNASSLLKMKLPIVPIAMAVLGKDTILPLIKTSKVNLRQKVLKFIARLIPRYQRCTYDECEVFSGIFGCSFWHENLSASMHQWFYKTSVSRLPMSAFPHLRKICNAGFIVDPNGQNKYLIHPERMTVPTLYISGGRTLLVTPETSFLANQYMRLHQPGFRHTRVVVDGFGHLDLLVGEESHKKVFPHILSHIGLVEKGRHVVTGAKESKYSKEALSWSDDPFEDRKRDVINAPLFSSDESFVE
ncbi:hypothetical protein Syun_016622 [Stephania yunnanensis]|uniref:Cholesterol oxidase n=1 Tax=Stephania yunnanensis TaxID=152371 RepID=A0AAP0P440_9MAGN